MVGPVFAGTRLDVAQVVCRVRVQTALGLLLKDFALDFQRYFAERGDAAKVGEKLLLGVAHIADARQVDGIHADGTGHRV
ncbi:hypothetical protein SDC9_171424 [bioreactor metagenome]|uniref:Uncharacterized protein n=1 Tax=bioreactor metagenome TaxID=1076179 RepID=A0A645GAV4_9ZZZZ